MKANGRRSIDNPKRVVSRGLVIGPARIRKVASDTGFRAEIVEKALYLEPFSRDWAVIPTWVARGCSREEPR